MIKKINRIFLTVTLLGSFIFSVSAQTDKKIEEIRKIYIETNQKIAESNENGEVSPVFLTELIVNKNVGSYPAVGNFRSVVKFYYTYGRREKNPYPNRLLKAEMEINRAARTENYEYLFNETGRLIFYFERKDDQEMRVYFSAEKPVKILRGEKDVRLNETAATDLLKKVLIEKRRLVSVFSNSLNF